MGTRRRWPASPEYLLSAVRRPWRVRPGRLVSALLPEGVLDDLPLGETISRLHPEPWPARDLWITAVSLEDGARVAFGRAGAPLIDMGTAVRCSVALPWLRRPVRHGPHRFVDGGMASPTHLDLLEVAPRLVIVSSPLSRYLPLKLLLRVDVRRLQRQGSKVVIFEPDGPVLSAMSWNPLDGRSVSAIAKASYFAARRQLDTAESAYLRRALFEITSLE
jgi:NTE family protein